MLNEQIVFVVYLLSSKSMPSWVPQLALQVYESPIAPKAGHAVEVMGSHNHLPINNVEGVGNVPLPLSQSLHQNGTVRPL